MPKKSSRIAAFYVDNSDFNEKWQGYQILESDLFDAIGDPDINHLRFRNRNTGDEFEVTTKQFLQEHHEFKYERVTLLVMPGARMMLLDNSEPNEWPEDVDWEILP